MGTGYVNIEAQVCALEYAKKLKELGIEQISLFYWAKAKGINAYGLSYLSNMFSLDEKHYEELYAAFTVAELGELLPNRITTKENDPFSSFILIVRKFYIVDENNKLHNNYIVNYECDTTEATGENAWLKRTLTANIFDENLANAMARYLIMLIENNVIEIK